MRCIGCKNKLKGLPLYNGKKKDYPDSILYCDDGECYRFGLLTVVFTNEEDNDEGVQPGDIQASG